MHRLLQYDDEVFALVTLALDGQSLAGSDSTFADSLYGMKRQAAAGAEAGSGGKPAGPGPRLSKRQRRLVLLCQVCCGAPPGLGGIGDGLPGAPAGLGGVVAHGLPRAIVMLCRCCCRMRGRR